MWAFMPKCHSLPFWLECISGVSRFGFVLGRAGCWDEGGIHGGTHFEQQAALHQQLVNSGQNLVGQLVFLQPVTEPKNGALIRQASKGAQLGKFAVQRCVEKGFFHGRVRQAEPLLHEVHTQHGFQGKG
jgi:hypothetical protein